MVRASSRDWRGPSLPGTTGTPAFFIILFASDLSPIAFIASGGGPIKINPLSIQVSAKFGFSARKP